MPNSREREWERRQLRVWSEEDQDWVAPPFDAGGPEKHNANTYSNWHCHCRICKADHAAKHRRQKRKEESSVPEPRRPSEEKSSMAKNSRSSGPQSAQHSSAVNSAGGGRTSTD